MRWALRLLTVSALHGPGEVEVSWPGSRWGNPSRKAPASSATTGTPKSAHLVLHLKPAEGCLIRLYAAGG